MQGLSQKVLVSGYIALRSQSLPYTSMEILTVEILPQLWPPPSDLICPYSESWEAKPFLFKPLCHFCFCFFQGHPLEWSALLNYYLLDTQTHNICWRKDQSEHWFIFQMNEIPSRIVFHCSVWVGYELKRYQNLLKLNYTTDFGI